MSLPGAFFPSLLCRAMGSVLLHCILHWWYSHDAMHISLSVGNDCTDLGFMEGAVGVCEDAIG